MVRFSFKDGQKHWFSNSFERYILSPDVRPSNNGPYGVFRVWIFRISGLNRLLNTKYLV